MRPEVWVGEPLRIVEASGQKTTLLPIEVVPKTGRARRYLGKEVLCRDLPIGAQVSLEGYNQLCTVVYKGVLPYGNGVSGVQFAGRGIRKGRIRPWCSLRQKALVVVYEAI